MLDFLTVGVPVGNDPITDMPHCTGDPCGCMAADIPTLQQVSPPWISPRLPLEVGDPMPDVPAADVPTPR